MPFNNWKKWDMINAYYRTIKENSMSYSIGIKFGFTEIPNIIQYVHCSKIDGSVIDQQRIFLEKKLSK